MKKITYFALILALVLTCGCTNRKNDTKVEKTRKKDNVITREIENDPFFDAMQTDERPVAVMIDNDVAASRPQMGLESAYMIYEIVVEGGATRFMALFKDHTLEKVGPVRSARHYFLDYALEHDAIYCHAGWSPQASKDISNLGVNNINGVMGSDGTIYWRDNTYDRSWHNLYTGVDKLYTMGTQTKKYRGTTDVKHNNYYKNDTVPATKNTAQTLSITYSDFYKVAYEYDETEKVYKRYVNGSYHMSQDGNYLRSKNVIVYKLRNYNLDDGENKGRQNLENIGSGSGYYFTDGKVQNITWTKSSRNAKTVYTLENGEELILNPGNTYVQIVPSSKEFTFNP